MAEQGTQFRLTGALLSVVLCKALYDAGTIPYLPRVLYAAYYGDCTQLAENLPGIFALDMRQNFGMAFSVRCSQDQVDLPYLKDLIDRHVAFRPFMLTCQEWDSGVADASSWDPIVSDIPTLVMTGEVDPNLSPSWDRRVSMTLTTRTFMNIPALDMEALAHTLVPRKCSLRLSRIPTLSPVIDMQQKKLKPKFSADPWIFLVEFDRFQFFMID